jgi:thymidylate synthase
MSAVDQEYSRILQQVRTWGAPRPNRTGVGTIAISSAMFQHDMQQGFPILHKKKISFKTSKVELIGFLLGVEDKRWYQSQGCSIWNEWCRPSMIPEDLQGDERLQFMKNCPELGPIYGSQWRRFNEAPTMDSDQIVQLLATLENAPDSRRMIVSAWNPLELHNMALPPCHFSFQVLVIGDYMHLNWNQRSVDLFLGLPYNICFYGLLLECLAQQFGYIAGMLTGFLGDTHIYDNHKDAVGEYLSRPDPEDCNPRLVLPTRLPSEFHILDENAMMKLRLADYNPLPQIKAEVAV